MNKEMVKEATQEEINARKAIATEREELTKNILHYIRHDIEHGICTYIDAEQLAAYLYDVGYRKIKEIEAPYVYRQIAIAKGETEGRCFLIAYTAPNGRLVTQYFLTENQREAVKQFYKIYGTMSDIMAITELEPEK